MFTIILTGQSSATPDQVSFILHSTFQVTDPMLGAIEDRSSSEFCHLLCIKTLAFTLVCVSDDMCPLLCKLLKND
jgi:hypothetical protein